MSEYYYYEENDYHRKTSLAEINLAEQLNGLARSVEDIVVMLSDVIEYLTKGDTSAVGSVYNKVRGSKEKVEALKDEALSYLVRIGPLLWTANIYRDSFIGLARIATNVDGIAYRASLMLENGLLQLPPKITDGLREITSVFIDQYKSLSYAIRLLMDNPRKAYESTTRVFNLEEEIDQRYRQISLDLYKMLKDEVVALLLLKDLTELLEDTADLVRDVEENVKFLSLYRQALA